MDLNNFIASENKKLYQAISSMELATIRSLREQVLEQYGFAQNTKVVNDGKEYEINFVKYDDTTVYMELLHEERVMYYYPDAPIDYETHVLRVNLKDFGEFQVVSDD